MARADLLDSPPPEPVAGSLSSLRPLQLQVVGPRKPDDPTFEHYLARYHYLSYRGPIGENLGYLIRSRTGIPLACLLFGAAAWQFAPRDRWIGCSPAKDFTSWLGLAPGSHQSGKRHRGTGRKRNRAGRLLRVMARSTRVFEPPEVKQAGRRAPSGLCEWGVRSAATS